jgi:hypothetical protein
VGGLELRGDVLRLFTDNPHRIMYVEDMAEALDRPKDSIRNCVYNMRRNVPGLDELIMVYVPGRAWRYYPPEQPAVSLPGGAALSNGQLSDAAVAPASVTSATVTTDVEPLPSPSPSPPEPTSEPPSARLFEELGTNTDGEVIVVDEYGQLYRLTAIDENDV